MLKSQKNFDLSMVRCWNRLSALSYLYFGELTHWEHSLRKAARDKNLKHTLTVFKSVFRRKYLLFPRKVRACAN